ncbi:MAG: simple sugar transport system permease protein [Fusobacteria bacterium]|nr:MAG: simple sugar transport system permease protein [Fusobacteriota bacterium]KAF0228642.1 MAG: simple sugar transport system permease [Fusobacteriota bacterium]
MINIKKLMLKFKSEALINNLFNITIAIVVALIISGIFILFMGVNPFYAFEMLFYGVFGSVFGIGEMLAKATPLLLVGLGVSIAFKGGMTNLGGDGQFLVGAILATIAGTNIVGLPTPIHMILIVIVAALGGAIWGGIAGFLKAKYNTNEVIMTIMMNYIALYIFSYLIESPLRDPSGVLPQSKSIPIPLQIPKLLTGTRAHIGIIFALILVIIVYLLVNKTMFGYKVKVIGISPKAAVYAGINTFRQTILIMAVSGAFAGIAGMVQVYAIHFRLLDGIAGGFGFSAIVVALLGRLNAYGILIASLFVGALLAGANSMQVSSGVPASIVGITQAVVILLILINQNSKSKFLNKLFSKKEREVVQDE